MKSRAHARRRRRGKALLAASILLTGGTIRADDFGAVTSGNWEAPSTWVSVAGGIIPGASDNVFIGSPYPTGAATTATVTLTANESANYVYVGFGYLGELGFTASQGTLALNGNTLTAYSITIGNSAGDMGAINESGGGSFSTNMLSVGGGTTTIGSGNSFTFGASDTAQNLTVAFGGSVTMPFASNIPAGGTIAVYQGGALDMHGNNINVSALTLGAIGNGSWSLVNYGTITTGNLAVGSGSLMLGMNDTTANLSVGAGGNVTTTVAGNISAAAQLITVSGGTLNLGADVNLHNPSSAPGTAPAELTINNGGTVDANGHNITADVLNLGFTYFGDPNPGTFTLDHPGIITATALTVANGSLTMGMNDVVGPFVNVLAGGHLTTTAAGNITTVGTELNVNGGTLTLGANLNFTVPTSGPSSGVDNLIAVYNGGTLDMQHNNITAWSLGLGTLANPGGYTLLNQGTITVNSLGVVGDPPLVLGPHDSVGNLSLYAGAPVTTSATTSIDSASVYGANSVLTLGGDLNVGPNGTIGVYDNGTINAQGHNLIANDIELGTDGSGLGWSLLNHGAITTNMLGLAGGTLALTSADSIANLNLGTGGSIALGQNVNFAGTFSLNGGATLDAQGHSLTANDIELGTYTSPGGWTLLHQGPITAYYLNVYGGPALALGVSDSVNYLGAFAGASVSTSAVGNVTGDVGLDGTGTTLSLGAALVIGNGGALSMSGGASLDAHGNVICVSQIAIGFYSPGAATLLNPGAITTTELDLGNGSQLTLTSGLDKVGNLLDLTGAGTTLTVVQSLGQTTGLTLNGAYSGALVIDPGASLVLDLVPSSGNDWIFRWLDPTGGDWISVIDGDIANGEIVVNAPNGYQVYDMNGYTYVGLFSGASVPEPSSIIMLGLGCASLIGWGIWRRHQGAQEKKNGLPA